MTPADMAAIHLAVMTTSAPWSEGAFRDTLSEPSVFVIDVDGGFALGRVVLDEAELLTLAVRPDRRRRGLGQGLLQGFETSSARSGAISAFLEVSEDNAPARALYEKCGWTEAGRRKLYYPRAGGRAADALILRKAI